MKLSEAWAKARDLISVESRWTQGEYARDAAGQKVDYDSPAACQWCALGAFRKVASELDPETNLDLRRKNLAFCGGIHGYMASEIATINDKCGHDALMSHVDNLIARIETWEKEQPQ